jgi:hypothetical protein
LNSIARSYSSAARKARTAIRRVCRQHRRRKAHLDRPARNGTSAEHEA